MLCDYLPASFKIKTKLTHVKFEGWKFKKVNQKAQKMYEKLIETAVTIPILKCSDNCN